MPCSLLLNASPHGLHPEITNQHSYMEETRVTLLQEIRDQTHQSFDSRKVWLQVSPLERVEGQHHLKVEMNSHGYP
jgi:hypothetical protein